MTTPTVDEFLARADDVLADWEGSEDAASWRADGGHEHDPVSWGWATRPSLRISAQMDDWRASMSEVARVYADVWEQAIRMATRAAHDLVDWGEVAWGPNPFVAAINERMNVAGFGQGPKPSRLFVDEVSGFRSWQQVETEDALAVYAARWLESGPSRVVGSLEPVAGCLPPLTARDVSLRVGWSVSLPPRRVLAPTAGPERKLWRVA